MCGAQENHCEMRISLNQKPNSSRDFGFQAVWDSTGARVTSIQAGTMTHSQGKHLQIRGHIWMCVALFSPQFNILLSAKIPSFTYPVLESSEEKKRVTSHSHQISWVISQIQYSVKAGNKHSVIQALLWGFESVAVLMPELCRPAFIWVSSARPETLFPTLSSSCDFVCFI